MNTRERGSHLSRPLLGHPTNEVLYVIHQATRLRAIAARNFRSFQFFIFVIFVALHLQSCSSRCLRQIFLCKYFLLNNVMRIEGRLLYLLRVPPNRREGVFDSRFSGRALLFSIHPHPPAHNRTDGAATRETRGLF